MYDTIFFLRMTRDIFSGENCWVRQDCKEANKNLEVSIFYIGSGILLSHCNLSLLKAVQNL